MSHRPGHDDSKETAAEFDTRVPWDPKIDGQQESGDGPLGVGGDLPLGYFWGADGLIYRQVGDGFRPASNAEINAILAQQEAERDRPRQPSVSVSLRDPRALAQEQQQFDESMTLRRAEFDEEQRRNRFAEAQAAEDMRFARDKLAIEEEAGKRSDAIRTQELIASIDARQQSLALERERIASDRRQFEGEMALAQQRLQLEQQESARDRAERQADRAESARRFSIEEGRQRARDLAEFSREPGDVASAIALQRAGGRSAISTALGQGVDLRTQQSLEPIEMLFDAATAQPTQPGGALAAPLTGIDPGMSDPRVRNAVGIADAVLGELGPGASEADLAAGLGAAGIQGSVDADAVSGATPFGVPTAEHGGIFRLPIAMVGDSSDGKPNEEFVIDLPGPGFAVLPKDQLEEAPKAQSGGIFGISLGGLGSIPVEGAQRGDRARSFLDAIVGEALRSLKLSRLPTPVQAATPGTTAFEREGLAGVTATGAGVPRRLFLEEALRLMPAALSGQPLVQRTG